MDNFLVPRHEIVAPADAALLLSQLGVDAKKIPKLLAEDPVIVEIGAKPGDLIKITRTSHTAGKSVYYRIVEA